MRQYPKRRLVLFFVHKDVVMAGFLILAYFSPLCGFVGFPGVDTVCFHMTPQLSRSLMSFAKKKV